MGCGGGMWWWYVVVICRDALVLAKVISFKELIKTLQNLGEINVKVSTHISDKQDGGGSLFRSEKVVCFALDPPKEPKKKAMGPKLIFQQYVILQSSLFWVLLGHTKISQKKQII